VWLEPNVAGVTERYEIFVGSQSAAAERSDVMKVQNDVFIERRPLATQLTSMPISLQYPGPLHWRWTAICCGSRPRNMGLET
jgi:hypothetical protein